MLIFRSAWADWVTVPTGSMNPTIIDTRAPKISRESTSRPMWSVPSRCAVLPPWIHAGGLKRWPREPISGLWGTTKSANTASSSSVARIAIGIIGNPSVR